MVLGGTMGAIQVQFSRCQRPSSRAPFSVCYVGSCLFLFVLLFSYVGNAGVHGVDGVCGFVQGVSVLYPVFRDAFTRAGGLEGVCKGIWVRGGGV